MISWTSFSKAAGSWPSAGAWGTSCISPGYLVAILQTVEKMPSMMSGARTRSFVMSSMYLRPKSPKFCFSCILFAIWVGARSLPAKISSSGFFIVIEQIPSAHSSLRSEKINYSIISDVKMKFWCLGSERMKSSKQVKVISSSPTKPPMRTIPSLDVVGSLTS